MKCDCGGKLYKTHTMASMDTLTIRVRRCRECGNNYSTTEERNELLPYKGRKKDAKRLHSKQELP